MSLLVLNNHILLNDRKAYIGTWQLSIVHTWLCRTIFSLQVHPILITTSINIRPQTAMLTSSPTQQKNLIPVHEQRYTFWIHWASLAHEYLENLRIIWNLKWGINITASIQSSLQRVPSRLICLNVFCLYVLIPSALRHPSNPILLTAECIYYTLQRLLLRILKRFWKQ